MKTQKQHLTEASRENGEWRMESESLFPLLSPVGPLNITVQRLCPIRSTAESREEATNFLIHFSLGGDGLCNLLA